MMLRVEVFWWISVQSFGDGQLHLVDHIHDMIYECYSTCFQLAVAFGGVEVDMIIVMQQYIGAAIVGPSPFTAGFI